MLHYRLQQLALPDLRHDVTWAQRTPASAPPAAHELAAGLDDRARALGERLAASPEPWLARQLGVLARARPPAARGIHPPRGTAAAYREAAGITNPEQAVSLEPHRNQPELEAMRKAVFAALEIRDEADIIGGLDRGELEARALHGQRARAVAPPDVSSQLRLTAQTEADAFQQSADARTQHDHTGAASATALAAQLAAERQRLEAHNARYQQWSADTRAARDMAGKATAELQRRGQPHPKREPHARPGDEPQTTAGWWRQSQADAEAAADRRRSPSRRTTWPPQGTPQPDLGSAPRRARRISRCLPSPPDDRTARQNELLAQADQAAQRVAAQQAERQASGEYAARLSGKLRPSPKLISRRKPAREPRSRCKVAVRARAEISSVI